jgi:hypothetical protein
MPSLFLSSVQEPPLLVFVTAFIKTHHNNDLTLFTILISRKEIYRRIKPFFRITIDFMREMGQSAIENGTKRDS